MYIPQNKGKLKKGNIGTKKMTKVAALNEEKGKNGLLQEEMDLVSYLLH